LTDDPSGSDFEHPETLARAGRDFVALGIAFAALILFIGTAGTLLPRILSSFQGKVAHVDQLLTNAVLLNIALIVFGWRRYADLQREIEVRRQAESRARELSERDPLTQSLNRRSGVPALRKSIEARVAEQRDLAIFMVDVDNFKQVNDIYGHTAGDAVLVETAERLSRLLPRDGLLVRIGGDEFACCMPFAPGQTDWIDYAALQMLEAVGRPIDSAGLNTELTVSIGIATHGHAAGVLDDAGCNDLIHRADIAMYQAKKSGRNRHAWFEPSMEDELRHRHELGAAIRAGLTRGEFVPYYEQQIELSSGNLVGFEMLARWRSPTYGLVMPDVFIPIAEEIDQIATLSEMLIRQAMLDAREWDSRLTLSVNISPVQLRDPWFAQRILKLLVDTGFPAGRLELEITESCLHMDIGMVRTIVTSLKNQGIRISLDDFGTGYSSLSQLRALPFDRIKIDRAFINELAADGSGELIAAIVALGRGLNLPITAEGIETPEVVALLRELGELKGQGYLYGLPEDAEDTRTRLAALELLRPAAAPAPCKAVADQSTEAEPIRRTA
jgi:diguanylate cyclase (GGDEF)-like protein